MGDNELGVHRNLMTLTKREKQRIRRRRAKGERLAEIGADFGLSRERIRQLTVGIPVPKREPKPIAIKPPRTYLLCPACDEPFGSENRCQGCGVTRYRVFPSAYVPPRARMRAMTWLSHAHPQVYRRLLSETDWPYGKRQKYALQELTYRFPKEYRALYLQARAEIEAEMNGKKR